MSNDSRHSRRFCQLSQAAACTHDAHLRVGLYTDNNKFVLRLFVAIKKIPPASCAYLCICISNAYLPSLLNVIIPDQSAYEFCKGLGGSMINQS